MYYSLNTRTGLALVSCESCRNNPSKPLFDNKYSKMCGIWFCLGQFCTANAKAYVKKVSARGPEETRIVSVAHAGDHGV